MRKRHTLIENIQPEPHTYLVTIGTDMGQFTGLSKCREEDWGYESQYFGYELAEIKAEIDYARAKRKFYEAQMSALTQFWREMSQTRTYDMDAYWVKKMRARVDATEELRAYWANQVQSLKEAYHINIVTFDTVNAKRKKSEEYNND